MTAQTLSADAVLDRLAAEVETPVYTGVPLAQGDIMVIPTDGLIPDATDPVPTIGIPLAKGNGGHTHLLLGRVFFQLGFSRSTLGTVTVPEGEVGYLAHGDGTPASALSGDADHDLVAFGPGTYVIRQQREFSKEWRQVAD